MKSFVIFKMPYLLIEDIKKRHKPFFKEYSKEPPNLLLNPALKCPFINGNFEFLHRKNKGGFCEVCYSRFNNYYFHIHTPDHKEFAEDSANYYLIDVFIAKFKQSAPAVYNKEKDSCLKRLVPDLDEFLNDYMKKN